MNVSASNATPVQSTQRPTQIQTQQTEQKAEIQARQQAEEVKKSEPAPARPVVNTQGQTTGRLLNVTA
jgi:hypothetical protein